MSSPRRRAIRRYGRSVCGRPPVTWPDRTGCSGVPAISGVAAVEAAVPAIEAAAVVVEDVMVIGVAGHNEVARLD
jgi:hypothetical protein